MSFLPVWKEKDQRKIIAHGQICVSSSFNKTQACLGWKSAQLDQDLSARFFLADLTLINAEVTLPKMHCNQVNGTVKLQKKF